MPQMFPLLWFFLFLMCTTALFILKTMIFFSAKKNPSNLSFKISNEEHNWKW